MGFKTLVVGLILFIIIQAVSGLFWDYLGAAGLFTLCSLKGNCKGPHKRDTDTLNEIRNMERNSLELLSRKDPSDCIRRLICDVSTGNEEYLKFDGILRLLSKKDEVVTPHHKKYLSSLTTAQKFGNLWKDVGACKERFKCPLTRDKFTEMMDDYENEELLNRV